MVASRSGEDLNSRGCPICGTAICVARPDDVTFDDLVAEHFAEERARANRGGEEARAHLNRPIGIFGRIFGRSVQSPPRPVSDGGPGRK